MRAVRSLFVLAGVLVLATGCRDLRGWDEVENAFENPSGSVSESSVGSAVDSQQDAGKADGANSVAGMAAPEVGSALDALYSALGSELATDRQGLIDGCDIDIKLNRNMAPHKITVDCAEGGEFSGVLSIELVWDGEMLNELYIDYGMWCEGGSCIDGSMGLKMDLGGETGLGLTSSILFNAKFRITDDGVEDLVDIAWRMTTDGTYGEFEWLVWVDGESIVMVARADATGGSFTIRGANGEFTCSYTTDGESGSCTGPDGTFSWSVDAAASA